VTTHQQLVSNKPWTNEQTNGHNGHVCVFVCSMEFNTTLTIQTWNKQKVCRSTNWCQRDDTWRKIDLELDFFGSFFAGRWHEIAMGDASSGL